MAKALIKAVDFVHHDPEIDRVGAHKRGDIIIVKPDDHVWGRAELDTNKFLIIDVPDSYLSMDLNKPDQELPSERISSAARKIRKLARAADRQLERKTVRRHRYRIDVDDGNLLKDKRAP